MAFHSLDVVDREAGLITELALTCPDRDTFRHQLLHRLDRLIGFDLATMQNSSDGLQIHLHTLGFQIDVLREQIPRHMAELDPREVVALCSGSPVVHSDIFPASRREQLSMYHEQLRPLHVTTVTIAGWRNRFGVFGTLLARTSPGSRFRDEELTTLERLLPSIKGAEALLCTMGGTHEDPLDAAFEPWASRIGLSPKEREVARLVAKGLKNQEISQARHVAVNTIRNQLSVIFRKAEVENRTELVRTMTETETDSWRSARRGSRRAPQYPWLTFVRGADLHPEAPPPEGHNP
jgi:DNA-binding CsgD family transcriptional regulator